MPYMNRIERSAIQCYPLLRAHLLQRQLHRVSSITLRTQLFELPRHCVQKLTNTVSSCRRDRKERFPICDRFLLQRLQSLRLVERIDLCGNHKLWSRRQLLVVRRELAIHRFVISSCIPSRNRRNIHEMQQQLRAPDVSQKTISQTRTRVRAFDQSRYIGNHESTKVTEIDYTEMRLERRERVVGNLRTRGRNSRDERRLTCIRKSHQTHVGE